MINKKLLQLEGGERILRERAQANDEEVEVHEGAKFCDLVQYTHLRGTNKRSTRLCANSACKRKTSYYCLKCSNVAESIFRPYYLTARSCFYHHYK